MTDTTQEFARLLQESTAPNKIRIEFDGGTPCNIPRLGYGIGYGSYQIQDCSTGKLYPVVRLNHGRPMSSNVAEISTLVRAIQDVVRTFGTAVELDIHGDSQIALKWARGATESGKKVKRLKVAKDEFQNAVMILQESVARFQVVKATWRGRERSVEVFGH